MSLSMHRVTSLRAINKTVQYDNRLTEFTNPPIHTGDLYVNRDLYVRRDLDVSGNVDISGNLDVSGNEHLSGNLDVSGNENVSGNLRVSGTILASQFLYGQVIFSDMFNLTSSNVDIGTSTRTVSIINWAYTPQYANSYIIAEFRTDYSITGSGSDGMNSQLFIGGSAISVNESNTNGRAGAMFPIFGKYTNNSLTQKNIEIRVYNGTDSDVLTVYRNSSTWLKVTEVGR